MINNITKHCADNIKYHWTGLEDMELIKSLDIFDYYKIYFHWWYIKTSLNRFNKCNFNICEFEDFNYEQACNHY